MECLDVGPDPCLLRILRSPRTVRILRSLGGLGVLRRLTEALRGDESPDDPASGCSSQSSKGSTDSKDSKHSKGPVQRCAMALPLQVTQIGPAFDRSWPKDWSDLGQNSVQCCPTLGQIGRHPVFCRASGRIISRPNVSILRCLGSLEILVLPGFPRIPETLGFLDEWASRARSGRKPVEGPRSLPSKVSKESKASHDSEHP